MPRDGLVMTEHKSLQCLQWGEVTRINERVEWEELLLIATNHCPHGQGHLMGR